MRFRFQRLSTLVLGAAVVALGGLLATDVAARGGGEPTGCGTDQVATCRDPVTIGNQVCTIDSTASDILIHLQASTLKSIPLTGSADISCGTEDVSTGKAPCSSPSSSIGDLGIPGIGTACLASDAVVCGTTALNEEVDCSGGNALEVSGTGDHNIGTCTGETDCEAQCDAFCVAPAGFGVYDSQGSCEGFCSKTPFSTCGADSDCFGGQGSCGGKDGAAQHTNTCGCVCSSDGGSGGGAGDALIGFGTAITVKSGSCAAGTTLIEAGDPICVGLSTQSSEGNIVDANNGTGKSDVVTGNSLVGAQVDCVPLAAGTLTGLTTVGHAIFFDSTIGDLVVDTTITCE